MATAPPRPRQGAANRPWSTHRVVAVRSVDAEAPGSSAPASVDRAVGRTVARRPHHPAPRLSGERRLTDLLERLAWVGAWAAGAFGAPLLPDLPERHDVAARRDRLGSAVR